MKTLFLVLFHFLVASCFLFVFFYFASGKMSFDFATLLRGLKGLRSVSFLILLVIRWVVCFVSLGVIVMRVFDGDICVCRSFIFICPESWCGFIVQILL